MSQPKNRVVSLLIVKSTILPQSYDVGFGTAKKSMAYGVQFSNLGYVGFFFCQLIKILKIMVFNSVVRPLGFGPLGS